MSEFQKSKSLGENVESVESGFLFHEPNGQEAAERELEKLVNTVIGFLREGVSLSQETQDRLSDCLSNRLNSRVEENFSNFERKL